MKIVFIGQYFGKKQSSTKSFNDTQELVFFLVLFFNFACRWEKGVNKQKKLLKKKHFYELV